MWDRQPISIKATYFFLVGMLTVAVLFFLPVYLSACVFQEVEKRAVVKTKVAREKRADEVDDEEADEKKNSSSEDESDNPNARPLPFPKKGAFEQIKKHTGELVKLEIESGLLTADFKKSYEQINPIVDQIRQKLGYGGGGGGSSYGSKTFRINFSTQKLSGRVECKTVDKSPTYILRMNETKETERTLLVQSSQKEGLSITINGGNVPYLFRLKQSPNGSVIVQEVDGANVFSCAAPSFDNFLQVNSEFSNERLVPLLKRFGIGQLKTPYDVAVQRQVLAKLGKLSKNEITQFVSIAGDINGDTYVARAKASEKLVKEFDKHRDLMMKVMNDPSFPPETRFRIQRIAEKKEKSDLLETIKYANQSGLTADIDYLFWLMSEQTEQTRFAEVGRHILGQLKLSDGQKSLDLVGERATTCAWLASRQIAFQALSRINQSEVEKTADPLSESGPMDKGREQMQSFIRLTIQDETLQLDREHWKQLFGGRTIGALSKEIEEQVTKSNLPKSWYRAGGTNTIGSSDYQQVHFELLAEKFGTRRSDNYDPFYAQQSRNSARNRHYESTSVRMNLLDKKTTRKNSKSKRDAKPVFQLNIQETKKPNRQLVITEKDDGKLDLRYISEQSNIIMQIVSTNDEVFLHDIRGGKTFAIKANTFAELVTQHGEYLKERFFPVFEQVGIMIDPALFNADGSKPRKPTGLWGQPEKK